MDEEEYDDDEYLTYEEAVARDRKKTTRELNEQLKTKKTKDDAKLKKKLADIEAGNISEEEMRIAMAVAKKLGLECKPRK